MAADPTFETGRPGLSSAGALDGMTPGGKGADGLCPGAKPPMVGTGDRRGQDETRVAVVRRFAERFAGPPRALVRAPGRVNLIGEHTDYNDGFVLPMAIDRAVWIALRPRADRLVRVESLAYEQELESSLDSLARGAGGWLEYVKGVAWSLEHEGYRLFGWEGVVSGDVPIGAGLSSSAALELACARAFAWVAELPWDPLRMALLAQRAENEWVGMNCGGMDQVIAATGRPGMASLIDCRSFHSAGVPLPPGTVAVILDTSTRRGLTGSEYNVRRAQCEEAARLLGVSALRDVALPQLLAAAPRLDPVLLRRARHVVTENARTLEAAAAMRRGDAHALGELMDQSHESLRTDFEVSSRELDLMVEITRERPGCYGARMTGGGFGGCAVALVRADEAPLLIDDIAADYQRRTGLTPALYVSGASGGASLEIDPRVRLDGTQRGDGSATSASRPSER